MTWQLLPSENIFTGLLLLNFHVLEKDELRKLTQRASADLSIFPDVLVNSILRWRTLLLVNPNRKSFGNHALPFPYTLTSYILHYT
jgi:hypothetical protein